MGDILDPADYPSVRYLLGGDSVSLPDAVIEAEPSLTYIEQVVKDMADGWSSDKDFDAIKAEDSKDWLFLRVGTMCLLAARLVRYLSMQEGAGFKIGGYSETGRVLMWQDRVIELIHSAAEAFARISTRAFVRPTILLATGPTSSGEAVPEEWEEWVERILPRILDWDEEGGEDDAF